MKSLCIDMDDFSLEGPAANMMNWMFYLKGKYPEFKITLFAIPGRSNFPWLWEVARLPWIELALHGWDHDEEQEINFTQLREWPFAKIYKGPNWKVTEREKVALAESGYILATKERESYGNKQWALTDGGALHGHIWVESDWVRIKNRIDGLGCRKFNFISEVPYD